MTGGGLLSRYSQIEWKKVMGMRDVISHHYFDMDAEIVYSVCRDYVPELRTVVGQIIVDLSLSGTGSERSPH